MILTGEAKEDFMKQFCGKFPIDNVLQNTYIIEWFDSVGIYIGTNPISEHEHYYVFETYVNKEYLTTQLTRQKSINHGIINANKIYNETKV